MPKRGDKVVVEGNEQVFIYIDKVGDQNLVTADVTSMPTQVFAYPENKVMKYVEPSDQEEASEPDAEGAA